MTGEDSPDTSKMGRTEELRQELRKAMWVERKHHRSSELNKNRAALGEMIENERYTAEFVVSKARVLKKKSLRIKEYQHLQNAFIQSEENIDSFLKVDNVLYALNRELSGNNPSLQLAAANCCCNIALGNVKACTSLAKSATPYLLAVWDSFNYALADICIWTIGNLAAGSDKAFETLHSQGILRRLLSLMYECDISLLPSVVYATMHCVHAGYNRIEDSEMVEITTAVVKRLNHHNDSNMIWLLALLSSRPVCVEHFLTLIPPLIDYLHGTAPQISNILQVTATIRILANVVWESSGQGANALLHNPNYTNEDINFLFEKLLTHPHTHLRKETLWLIGNLYNHPLPQIPQAIQDLTSGLVSLKQAALSITKTN